jgi:uncharacterized protein
MNRSGHADLPLHYGHVPPWLAERMARLGGAIIESIIMEYGKPEVLKRISDPFWFQSLGCVLGMDWHSSGITTSVMGALKKAVNPRSKELGIYICGGKGRYSRETPNEITKIADKTGLDGAHLIQCSRLSAKVDNTAIQDGFQLYLHSFVLSSEGEWAVVQQGMNGQSRYARRYHWHSRSVRSFTEEPHTFIYGKNQGLILNLTDREAAGTRKGVLAVSRENPLRIMTEIKKLVMPAHHEVRSKDVDLKRLGAVLALAEEKEISDFEGLLLLEGLGPRTLQSLTLVSEVIHGTPSRFRDPARFSFAHGGKDGHPFPVPTKVYDETIEVLGQSIRKAKIGNTDKQKAIRSLSEISRKLEKDFIPNNNFENIIEQERNNSYKYGGKTVFGDARPPSRGVQLKLF